MEPVVTLKNLNAHFKSVINYVHRKVRAEMVLLLVCNLFSCFISRSENVINYITMTINHCLNDFTVFVL